MSFVDGLEVVYEGHFSYVYKGWISKEMGKKLVLRTLVVMAKTGRKQVYHE